MENSGRLYAQVAAEADVTAEKAIVACYLNNLSRDGKTLDEAARLLRRERADVRDQARDWGLTFPDYTPSVQPLQLVWRKEKRGQWRLLSADIEIAEAHSDGRGGYVANTDVGGRLQAEGSSAEVAMRRLSIDIDRRAHIALGTDDVRISVDQGDDGPLLLAPKLAADPDKLRRALSNH